MSDDDSAGAPRSSQDLRSQIEQLYKARVLDHARNPRNFGPLAHPTHQAVGHNPLCGDQLTLRLRIDGARIAEVAFEGAGCALSIASASLMTTAIADTSEAAARSFQAAVISMLSDPEAGDGSALGDVAALGSVRAFPARVKCVTLAWQTLAEALDA